MIKLYKRDGDRLLYREAWVANPNLATVHCGAVGRTGKSEEQAFEDERAFFERFRSQGLELGYAPIDETEMYWLVIQFPLKSEFGNKRDRWLRDKVEEHLNEHLGWCGLGHVDGHDIGNHKLNVFCLVVDDDLGVAAAKSCLRTSRLDLARARFATRRDGDEDYLPKYSQKPAPDFSVW